MGMSLSYKSKAYIEKLFSKEETNPSLWEITEWSDDLRVHWNSLWQLCNYRNQPKKVIMQLLSTKIRHVDFQLSADNLNVFAKVFTQNGIKELGYIRFEYGRNKE